MTYSQINKVKENVLTRASEYTQAELDAVMAQNVNLTRNGIESTRSQNYASNRAELKESLKAFQMCCAYLSFCTRKKTPCKLSMHTGSLKSQIEYFTKVYIPSGALVAAADALGIKYKTFPESTFVCLHISSKLPLSREMEFSNINYELEKTQDEDRASKAQA